MGHYSVVGGVTSSPQTVLCTGLNLCLNNSPAAVFLQQIRLLLRNLADALPRGTHLVVSTMYSQVCLTKIRQRLAYLLFDLMFI